MSGTMLQQLQGFNKDTISEEMVELCEVYIRLDDYNLERAKKVAGAVAGLTSWTEAMCTFYWWVENHSQSFPRNGTHVPVNDCSIQPLALICMLTHARAHS